MKVEIRNKPIEINEKYKEMVKSISILLNIPFLVTDSNTPIKTKGVVYYNGEHFIIITEFFGEVKHTFIINTKYIEKTEPVAAALSLIDAVKDPTPLMKELEEFKKHVEEMVQLAKRVEDKL